MTPFLQLAVDSYPLAETVGDRVYNNVEQSFQAIMPLTS